MKFRYNKEHIKSLIAGFLVLTVISLPLSGCSGVKEINTLSSEVAQAVSDGVSSAINSSKTDVSSLSSSSKPVSSLNSSQTSKTKSKSTGKSDVLKEIPDNVDNENVKLSPIRKLAETSQAYTYIYQREGYNYLSDTVSRGLYNKLLQSAYKVSQVPNSQGYYPGERVNISGYHISEAQLRIIITALLNDNPQVFWLANSYSYGYGNNGTQVRLYSVAPQNQLNTMIQNMNNKIHSIIKAMPLGISEFDRELYLYDYIAKNCVYDNDAVTNHNKWQSFSAYGALIDGKAVCEGYSRAMQLLSSYSGLHCMLLTGNHNSSSHMWNAIRINGKWYHLDITWGDGDNEPIIYNYFNLNDSEIHQNRTVYPAASSFTEEQIIGTFDGNPAEYNLFIPVCTSTEQNYYKIKGIRIDNLSSSNDSAVVNSLSSIVKAKKSSVSFYIGETADYDSISARMVTKSPYKVSEYFNRVNNKPGITSKIDLSKIRYINDKANRGITFFLSYK